MIDVKKCGSRIGRLAALLSVVLVMGVTSVQAQQEENILVARSDMSVQSMHDILVNVQVEKASLAEVFETLEKQANLRFLYNKELIEASDYQLSLGESQATVATVLEQIGWETGLGFRQINRIISVNAEQMRTPPGDVDDLIQETVVGRVVDADSGDPLPGVNIIVMGSEEATGSVIGAQSDLEGNYSVEVPEGLETLAFTYIGYQRLEVPIQGRNEINVQLAQDVELLEDVVVVGYGTQRRANLTGSLETISGADISSRPAPQTGQLLQGHSPSMLVSMSARGGEPGADQNFSLRGVGSISGDNSPLVLVDGIEMDMNLVDPSTIEDITILKDASASAVYGSRAAFGVILIQTKQGGNRPARVTYNNITSANVPYYVPSMLDSYTYATVFNQAQGNAGLGHIFGPDQVDRIKGYMDGTYDSPYDPNQPPFNHWRGRWDGNDNVNWPQEFFTDYSIQQKHTVNIDGGNETTQYYTSVGFQDQPGILNWGNDSYKRYNLIGNVTTQATDWAKFDFSARYTNTETDRANGGVWGDRSGYWMHINIMWPTTPYQNLDGSFGNPIVVALRDGGRIVRDQSNSRFTLGTELEPIDGWTTNIRYNYTNRTGSTVNEMYPVTTQIPNGTTGNIGFPQNSIYQQLRTGHYSVLTAYTQYEQEIEEHYFSAMGGFERDYDYNRWVSGEAGDVISMDVPAFSTALGNTEIDDTINHWATQGFFGRLNYNYDERYMVEVSARYDGSSRFEEGQRWGLFPSASVGYNISREEFWEPIKPYVNMLRLRASYGSLGNQSLRPPSIAYSGQSYTEVHDPNAANYLYLEEIPVSQQLGRIMDGTRPFYADIPAIRSEYLTWETVTTTNLGFELSTLDDRLLVEFDWYNRITDDMMGPSIELPSLLGASAPRANNAKLETKGFELSVAWRDMIGEVFYNARLSLGDSKTTILEYVNETGNVHTWYADKQYGDVWGLTTGQIMQDASDVNEMADQSYYHNNWGPGDIMYRDLDGDGVIDPGNSTLEDHGDLSIITNTSPRYQISFTGEMNWRSWDFSMFWQGILDQPFIPQSGSEFYWGHTNSPASAIFLEDSHHLDYWRPSDETNFLGSNTDAYLPKPYFGSERNKNMQTQTRFIENARYFRLKNLQLGYTLPSSVTDRTPLENLRIFFSGENLLTIQSLPKAFEPEGMIASNAMMRTYPISRMLSLGLSVTF
ncbi:MAG: SusC/RagA family TonB-linked outer membrane protein [Bacteroidota bacterium]